MQKKPKQKQLDNLVVPKMADIWHRLAIQLNFTPDEVERIKRNRPETSVKDHFTEMFRLWLDRNTDDDSTKADEVIEAIKTIGHRADANEIEAG